MKLTKQRKVCAAFLGLAAVAFACDRVFFQPAGADAATDATAVAPESPAEAKVEAKPAPAAPAAPSGPALAAKLQAVAGDVKTDRDPFRRVWIGPAKTASSESQAQAELNSPVEFSGTYELTALMNGSGGGVAVVARKSRDVKKDPATACAVGKGVAGWTLASVDAKHSTATFERAGAKVTLELKAPPKVDNATVTKR